MSTPKVNEVKTNCLIFAIMALCYGIFACAGPQHGYIRAATNEKEDDLAHMSRGADGPGWDSSTLPHPMGGIHHSITMEALTGILGKGTANNVSDAIFYVDYDETKVIWDLPPGLSPNSKYVPAHHFDRAYGVTDTAAFLSGRDYVLQQRQIFRDAFLRGDRSRAIDALGRMYHALEDFFSHSNFIDLSSADQRLVEDLLSNNSVNAPSSLRICGYDAGAKVYGLPPGDPFPHDLFSKDSPHKNPEAQRKMADGRTKYAHAYEKAVSYVRNAMRLMLDELAKTHGFEGYLLVLIG